MKSCIIEILHLDINESFLILQLQALLACLGKVRKITKTLGCGILPDARLISFQKYGDVKLLKDSRAF
jgi:hypothetical protein